MVGFMGGVNPTFNQPPGMPAKTGPQRVYRPPFQKWRLGRRMRFGDH
jgi:hypothetical protein